MRSLSRQNLISDTEVIVVDGMSRDHTADVAENFPFVRVVKSEPGRARQMNNGALAASSPILWFLHADSTLPDRYYIDEILAVTTDPQVKGGCFRFHLRGNDAYYKFVTALVNFRARWLNRPYGDQGIFVRAEDFQAIGGFREDLQTCEDIDLVLRLRKIGQFRLMNSVVETSARTWQHYGKLRTTFAHLTEFMAFEFKRLFSREKPMELPESSPLQAAGKLAAETLDKSELQRTEPAA